MKKAILLLAAASILAPAAVAQQKLVDEVAKAVASSANKAPQLKAALDQIQPALTNAESKDSEPWVRTKNDPRLSLCVCRWRLIAYVIDFD